MAVVALAFAGFILLGVPHGALGVAWPSLSEDLHRSLAELGVVLLAATAAYMVATALNGRLSSRYGTGRLLVASSAVSAASLFGYAAAPHWWLLLTASFTLGAGGGIIDAGVNAYMAVHHGARVMNLLHASYGLGATVGPLLMTVAIDGLGSWRAGYVVLGVAQLGLGGALWRWRGRWTVPAVGGAEGRRRRPAARSGLLLVMMLVLFLLYTGVEVAAGQWSFTLLTRERAVADGAAAVWVSAYWGSFTGGRLLAGLAGAQVAPERLLRMCLAGAVIAAGALWWSPQPWIGNAGLAALGFSLGPVFPSLVLLTPRRLGDTFAPWAIGYELSAASAGAAVVPAAIGAAIAVVGLGSIGPALFIAATTMALVAVLVDGMAARLERVAAST